MSVLQNLTHSKHEEAKCKTISVDANSQEFVAAHDFLKLIFGKKIKMKTSEEYSVSFSFRRNHEDVLCFACNVKKFESDVSESQLSLFGPLTDGSFSPPARSNSLGSGNRHRIPSSGNPPRGSLKSPQDAEQSGDTNITEIKTRVSNA